MGEYWRDAAGTSIKVGVCEDWGYVRRSEAEQLAPLHAAGEGVGCFDWALNGGDGDDTRGAFFRFPFPDEDATAGGRVLDLSGINRRDMSRVLTVRCEGITCGHRPDCKAAAESERFRAEPLWNIVAERYYGRGGRDGRYTVIGCHHCGQMFSMDEVETARLRAAILAGHITDPRHGEIPGAAQLAIAERISVNARTRKVGRDTLGPFLVSTVWIPVKPGYYETLVSDTRDNAPGELEEGFGARYPTYDEANAGHKATVERVRRELL
jgi:hypothetical protein